MADERERMVRFLENDITEAEAAELRGRLENDMELRQQLERVSTLTDSLRAGAPNSFAPLFSERVLRRLVGEDVRSESLYDSLRWVFPRAAVASLTLAAVLGAFNFVEYQALDVAASTIEAIFGLPSASLADALSYGAM